MCRALVLGTLTCVSCGGDRPAPHASVTPVAGGSAPALGANEKPIPAVGPSTTAGPPSRVPVAVPAAPAVFRLREIPYRGSVPKAGRAMLVPKWTRGTTELTIEPNGWAKQPQAKQLFVTRAGKREAIDLGDRFEIDSNAGVFCADDTFVIIDALSGADDEDEVGLRVVAVDLKTRTVEELGSYGQHGVWVLCSGQDTLVVEQSSEPPPGGAIVAKRVERTH